MGESKPKTASARERHNVTMQFEKNTPARDRKQFGRQKAPVPEIRAAKASQQNYAKSAADCAESW